MSKPEDTSRPSVPPDDTNQLENTEETHSEPQEEPAESIASNTPSLDAGVPEDGGALPNTDALPDGDGANASDASTDAEESAESDAEGTEQGEDDLPEWEPLTPELVEDEAIRGDFMLRWAVVLLAFLLGCSKIIETTTLVHVKIGQYLMSHGGLPPETDVFSSTAGDRPWINLNWLFDIAAAAIYDFAGGAAALSLLTALLAGFTFYVIGRISVADVSSWWGSICGAIALLCCYPLFMATPALLTLAGTAVVLYLLQRFRTDSERHRVWRLVPLFALWVNLDPRAYIGLAILALYFFGDLLGAFLGFSSPIEGRRKTLTVVTLASLAAFLVTPFGWQSLQAPWLLYTVEYPALQTYFSANPSPTELQNFSMLEPVFWESWTQQTIAGILLVATAALTFVLNRSRFDLGQFLVLLGSVAMAVSAAHELAVASIVACVLATVNAQEWYRASFRQTYSVDMAELLFSRGGRAVTVLAYFGLAFLVISGRLAGPDGKRTGLGFDPRLEDSIAAYRADLDNTFDDRPFHFLLSQGDLLIWIDQKSFVDNRVALFSGTGEDDILGIHNQTRYSLRQRRPTPLSRPRPSDKWMGDRRIWQSTFDRFQVSHVLPRLSTANGSPPDYTTYFDLLLSSNSWALTELGASTAVFTRRDTDNSDLNAYVAAHEIDMIKRAFRSDVPSLSPRSDWPREPSVYQEYFTMSTPRVPNPVQEATHYYRTIIGIPQIPVQLSSALAYLAIRKANEGLVDDPNSAEAFRVLGSSYAFLNALEAQIVSTSGVPFQNQLRYYQTVMSFQQSLIVEPDAPDVHFRLMEIYYQNNKPDLALASLDNYLRLTETQEDPTEQEVNQRKQYVQLRKQLAESAEQVEKSVQDAIKEDQDRFGVAQQVYQNGFVAAALKLLEDDRVYLAKTPPAQNLHSLLLLEAGRVAEAAETLGQLEALEAQIGPMPSKTPLALARLANGEYDRAVQLWTDQINDRELQQLTGILSTLPLTSRPVELLGQKHILFPIPHTATIQAGLVQLPTETSALTWNTVLCHLEAGHNEESAKACRRILETDPETSFRPLIQFYLYQLTEEMIELEPPSNLIPITPDLFAPEPEASKSDASKSDASKSDASKSDASKPEASKPEEPKPETAEPETAATETKESPFARWEKSIAAFEAQDREKLPAAGGVLFVGSSSIRMWKLTESFPKQAYVNRGFGGSQIADVNHFADRIIFKYRPQTIFLYAGDNDIAAGKSPQRVADDFKTLATRIRTELPESRLVFLCIKPSIKRWNLIAPMREANSLIEAECRSDEHLIYLDVATPMLGDNGEPRPELFAKDGLHMNAAGYEIWTSLAKPLLP